MRLLYAEDEPLMSEAVVDILTFHKYTIDAVEDGESALEYARTGQYDGIILDVMMPGKSGTEVLRELRAEGIRTPVMLLTAKAEVEDRIEGLDLGADDYLPKPFAMGELLARVRAMLRRRGEWMPEILTVGDLSLNPGTHKLICGEKGETLPNLEYQFCEVFFRNRGIYLSAETLLVRVWGYDSDVDTGTVWVYVSGLRKRLARLGSRVRLESKRNTGYMLSDGCDGQQKKSGK